MDTTTVLALVLALVSTTLINLAYLREHEAAASMPALSLRRPVQSVVLLFSDRSWLAGFAMESGGFILYAIALALASLALVQSISAGGIGVLAFVSARMAARRLTRRELTGVLVSAAGLAALAVSLAGGNDEEGTGELVPILLWLGASGVAAAIVLTAGKRLVGVAVANGVAGGLLFSVGDISTKVATQGGARLAFAVTLVAGYTLGTALLQLGYQAGGALTVAGIATLLTNALPIAAGTIVLEEPVPAGVLGVVRLVAFVAVCAGACLLAAPQQPVPRPEPGDEAPEPAPAG